MNLPLLVFTIFVEIAVSGMLFLLLNDFRQDAPRGYMAFAGFVFLCFGGLAYALLSTYPPENTVSRKIHLDMNWLGLCGSLLGWFLVALILYIFMVGVGTLIARRIVGSIALILAVGALVSLGYASRDLDSIGILTILSFFVGSLNVGAVTSGMFLGHWYLVDPAMTAQPLQRVVNIFLFSLGLELILILITVPSGWSWSLDHTGIVQASAQFWGLIGVGLLLPAALGVLIYKTCKMKSMQSATGLLYIVMSLVLAGEILAKLIFFQTNVQI